MVIGYLKGFKGIKRFKGQNDDRVYLKGKKWQYGKLERAKMAKGSTERTIPSNLHLYKISIV